MSDPARRRTYDRDLAEQEKPKARRRVQRNISQDVYLRLDEFFRGAALEVEVKDPANPEREVYSLTIPPETAPGTRFRIPRTGALAGGVVQVRVKARPNFRFKVRGSDLRCDLRINARLAAEGGRESIPGATGRALTIKIPARIERGEIIRVAGEGLPKARGGRGDLLVKITYRPEVRITRSRAG